MIKSILHYIKNETHPRICCIILGSEFLISALLCLLMGYFGPKLGLDKVKISSLSGAFLNYSAIAFGFAVTGMTLAISIPSKELAVKMAKTKVSKNHHSTYSDLIFVFSWTAVVHLISILACLSFIMLTTDTQMILSSPPQRIERALLAASSFLMLYGLANFLITIITISQVGAVYINDLSKDSSGS
jgi:hypothetical protein